VVSDSSRGVELYYVRSINVIITTTKKGQRKALIYGGKSRTLQHKALDVRCQG
jgi:hypothetical protein